MFEFSGAGQPRERPCPQRSDGRARLACRAEQRAREAARTRHKAALHTTRSHRPMSASTSHARSSASRSALPVESIRCTADSMSFVGGRTSRLGLICGRDEAGALGRSVLRGFSPRGGPSGRAAAPRSNAPGGCCHKSCPKLSDGNSQVVRADRSRGRLLTAIGNSAVLGDPEASDLFGAERPGVVAGEPGDVPGPLACEVADSRRDLRRLTARHSARSPRRGRPPATAVPRHRGGRPRTRQAAPRRIGRRGRSPPRSPGPRRGARSPRAR